MVQSAAAAGARDCGERAAGTVDRHPKPPGAQRTTCPAHNVPCMGTKYDVSVAGDVAGAQDIITSQQLVSDCKELLREVREHRNLNADTLSQHQDVTVSAAAGRPQSSDASLGDLRLQPSFLRALSLALQKGARDKSGLFGAPASIALASIVEALARILLENAEGQDLAARSSPSITQALHLVMQSGNKDAVGWSALALSQIAIRRPETAISM